MTINSIPFLFFFIIVFLLYYISQKSAKAQNFILLLSSMFFYGNADWRMLILMAVSIFVIWWLGTMIEMCMVQKREETANKFVIIGIIYGVGLLFYFKYLNFFILSFETLFYKIGLISNCYVFDIIMPLGISFFTFRMLSYLIDIRQKKMISASFIDVATYISFFPCILSGPIDRSVTFIPQLWKPRKFEYSLGVEGCQQLLWGMFKKMVVADGLSLFISRDIATSTGSTLFIVAIMYSIQIYADFSGYSDMAIGVGKLLGIRITRNFHYPYFSRSVAEFWNRWHMSLLGWFRYYIYFPLGGSRCAKSIVIRNTFIVFLVSGLWHGANWTFVVWGIFHALLFLPSLIKREEYNPNVNIVYKKRDDAPYKWKDIFNVVLVFMLITVGWIIFRCESISEAGMYMAKVCSPSLLSKPAGVMWALPSMVFAVIMFAFEWKQRKEEFPLINFSNYKVVRWGVYLLLILTIVYYQGKPADFIYFKF